MERFTIPEPAAEPVPEGLRKLLDATPGANWKHKRQCEPDFPEVCSALPRNKQLAADRARQQPSRPAPPKEQPFGPIESAKPEPECPPCGQKRRATGRQPPWFGVDRSFAVYFPPSVVDLRDKLGVLTAIRPVALPTVSISTVVSQLGGEPHTIERREACKFVSDYLTPLLDGKEYTNWLTELTRAQFYWRGAQPPVPPPVAQQEATRDQQLILDLGLQPHSARDPFITPSQSRAALEYARQQAEYERQLAQGRAFITGSSASRDEARIALAPPLVVLNGQPVPANLFISEVGAAIDPYLRMLYPVLQGATVGLDFLRGPLVGAAYGVLALALVPIHCVYDAFHGTCAVEDLLPKLEGSRVALRSYAGTLQAVLQPLITDHLGRTSNFVQAQNFQENVRHVLTEFGAWATSIADWLQGSNRALVMVAATQSGGRVRTPLRFTTEGEWEFNFVDEAKQPWRLRAQELIGYDRTTERDKTGGERSVINRDAVQDREAFWMLTAIWERVATAAALVNQAGMRFYINAANNRWGGYHPPHGPAHRQGCSIDFDVGFAWKRDHKVPNLKKRDKQGLLLKKRGALEGEVDCLRYMDRLAAWIGIQAFLLAGVRQYINADVGLLEGATLHLVTRFKIEPPAITDPLVDPEGHNDHWHFEVLDVPCPPTVPGNPYVFAVKDPDILARLHSLALQRDQTDSFWRLIAGIKKAPKTLHDFDTVPDGRTKVEWEGDPQKKLPGEKEDWITWWSRKDTAAGIPLLPVWADEMAAKTTLARECWSPVGDYHIWAPDAV